MPSEPSRRTALKSLALGAAACMLDSGDAQAAPAIPAKLPRARPEALGIDPNGLLAFVEAVEQKAGGLHSFMLLRHGQVAAEGWWSPYAPQHPHMLFSLSKSFTSTAVGLAVTEGRLTVDDPITSFFPDDLPVQVSENLAAMRVRHLLTMSTGHDKDATYATTSNPDGNWVRGFLSLPVEHAPGSKFVYNSAATYMLSAIVQKRTGKTVLDYLTPHLFDPLGIQGQAWETCPRRINTGGWGLSIKTEDIAKFGQLLLQKGVWQGAALVPEKWITEATSKQVSNGDPASESDWSQGYGYQFWRCRHGAFRGDGAFGQYCVVMPELNAVLAITSGVKDMQAVLNVAWEHLLPAMQHGPITGKRSADIKRKLASLAVHPPEGKPDSETAKRVSGQTYRFESNDQKLASATLTFTGSPEPSSTLILRYVNHERHIVCGGTNWRKGTTALDERTEGKAAVRGVWKDDNTYTVALCFYETPFLETLTWTFADDQVTLERKLNVGFGPTEWPPVKGRRA